MADEVLRLDEEEEDDGDVLSPTKRRAIGEPSVLPDALDDGPGHGE